MNFKYILLTTVLASGLILTSCNETETSSEEETTTTSAAEESQEEEIEESPEKIDEYADYSVQGQWDDIVFQVGTGNPDNLNIYVDEMAPTFSEQEWGYIDFSDPRYAEAFASYDSFEDLPDAEYFAPGAKVVTVSFTDEVDGMTFESTSMIYLEERDGLLWIIGAAMAG